MNEFIQNKETPVLIVWGHTGVGKSSYVHLALRKANIWPHTIENLYDYVRVGGVAPKLFESMKRILSRKMPGGREEAFFLDHVEAECINNPEEIKRIVRLAYTDKFLRSGKKLIVGIDNLYAKECAPFRKFLQPVRANTKRRIIGTSARFWPLKDKEVRTLLQQRNIFSGPTLACGLDVAKGDARQAILYADMLKRNKGKSSATSLRDMVVNPFVSCKAAFKGDKGCARAGGNFFLLRLLVHYNYPYNLTRETSVWNDTRQETLEISEKMARGEPLTEEEKHRNKEKFDQDMEGLKALSATAGGLSDMGCMAEEHADEVLLGTLATNRWLRDPPHCKWPFDMYYEKQKKDNAALSVNMRQLLGLQMTDMTIASSILTAKIDAEVEGNKKKAPVCDWAFSNGVSRVHLAEQAGLFQGCA